MNSYMYHPDLTELLHSYSVGMITHQCSDGELLASSAFDYSPALHWCMMMTNVALLKHALLKGLIGVYVGVKPNVIPADPCPLSTSDLNTHSQPDNAVRVLTVPF